MLRKNVFRLILSLVLISIFSAIFFSSELKADCSFWVVLSKDKVPEEVVVNSLLNSVNSLKSLAKYNNDGWGIGYYDNGEAITLRGGLSADKDDL